MALPRHSSVPVKLWLIFPGSHVIQSGVSTYGKGFPSIPIGSSPLRRFCFSYYDQRLQKDVAAPTRLAVDKVLTAILSDILSQP